MGPNFVYKSHRFEKNGVFELIGQTGKTIEFIKEDLPRIKQLNLLTVKETLNGVKKLMKFYENDENIFNLIIDILLSFKFENGPDAEKWEEKRAVIFQEFPITEARVENLNFG